VADEFVTVGKLGRTRGVQGDLYIIPLTDFPERFENIREIFISSREGWQPIKVASTGTVGGRLVIRFEEVTSREEAARFTNKELAVPKDQLVKLPEDSFYIFDLVGCKVYTEGSEQPIGEVTEVEQYPANDVYRVRTSENTEILIPALKRFVKSVDIKAKRIVVDEAGLLTE
jgi:16S rRNA processing protein RimM